MDCGGKQVVYKVIMILCLLFILLGCDSGLYTLVSRPQKDPDTFEIKVDSFSKEYEIYCKWECDELTDKYILMRSEDSTNLHFNEVYRGESISYIDCDLKDNTKYIYRLDKVRGNKKFIGNKYFLGIFSEKKDDEYEPNNSTGTATFLESPKQGNAYYYTSEKGIIVSDIDWYWVRIKANRQVNLTLTYDAAKPVFRVILPPNGNEKCPADNEAFQIRNDTNEERAFYFSIQIDKATFQPTNSAAFFTYTLKLVSETAISD